MKLKVLIVARTRRGSRACVGAISLEGGRSLRLVAADDAVNERAGMQYAVGEVWEVEGQPAADVVPPHVENFVVWGSKRLGPMTDPVPFIERHMPPLCGAPDRLYEGLLQAAEHGSLYVAQAGGVPPYSTAFWRPDRDLQLVKDGVRLRYRYAGEEGLRSLVFVGFQEPLDAIPQGTLVRVSLAHWWRRKEEPAGEERCYVQLSGWFIDSIRGESDRRRGSETPYEREEGNRRRGSETPCEREEGDRRRGSETPCEREFHLEAGSNERGQRPRAGDERAAEVTDAPQSAGAGQDGQAGLPLGDARARLKAVFGYDDFRPLQAEIVSDILAGRDVLAVMPTGSGKSLCYQLPALLLPGLTVVVSPLISLMQDQVDQLRQAGAAAAFLNSSLDYAAYASTMRQVRQGAVKLLYTSPETLLRPETLVLLDDSRLRTLAIDEAHCISAWGHDFRPEYRQLAPIRRRYPAAACAAFTATATPRVRDDIRHSLGLEDAQEYVASFDRPNLHLRAERRGKGGAQVLDFLAGHAGESGIVYCQTRKQVDDLAEALRARGVAALPYHAGLDDATRRRHQAAFARDDAPVMVATVAFGMGINKSNVRFVLHYNLPHSLEQYYQEIGRAGRDGLPAECLLLYEGADLWLARQLIEEGDAGQRAGRNARLEAIFRFAEAGGCRRRLLLAYFDELLPGDNCAACDNCLKTGDEGQTLDATTDAVLFLQAVQATGQVFGAAYIVDVLRGSRSQRVLGRGHERLACYGSGKQRDAAGWRALAHEMIRQGLLKHDMEHGSLSLMVAAGEVLRGERRVLAAAPAPSPRTAPGAGPTGPAGPIEYERELFEQLRTLRRELAVGQGVPPYVIFSDRTLAEMAAVLPHSPQRLLQVHGVGERKLAQYGEAFLAAIRAYCARHGLAERGPLARPAAPLVATRTDQVGALFEEGRSIGELQALFEVQRTTIINHLWRYCQAGHSLPAERLRAELSLPEEDQQRALELFGELGAQYLRPVFDALGERVSFEDLHVLRMVYLAGPAAGA